MYTVFLFGSYENYLSVIDLKSKCLTIYMRLYLNYKKLKQVLK